MPVRVLVLATYPTVRYGLRAVIDGEPGFEVVGTATSLEELADLAVLELPDVILGDLDWTLEEIEQHGGLLDLAPVLLIVDDVSDVGDALRAGARGVLLRDADAEQLGAALRALSLDMIVVDSRAGAVFVEAGDTIAGQESHEQLTAREIEVLQLIAQGLPNKGIALELGISEHTVKFHVGSILAKLGAASRAEALGRAMTAGLVTV